jgi:hypothetical protein
MKGTIFESERQYTDGTSITYAAVVYSNRAKIRFGTPYRNKANLASVRHHVRKDMEENNMRKADIRSHIDMAVALTFFKSDEELACDSLFNNNGYKRFLVADDN